MNTSGDAAESIVRMGLQGFDVAARITGSGAKEIAILLYTILKDKEQVKGKTKLVNMLKSGKELKVFSIKEDDFKKFTDEAKRYGVLFSALINKKEKNSKVRCQSLDQGLKEPILLINIKRSIHYIICDTMLKLE